MFFDPYIQAIYKHRTNMLRITAVDEAIYDSLIMLRSMYATSLRISWSQCVCDYNKQPISSCCCNHPKIVSACLRR